MSLTPLDPPLIVHHMGAVDPPIARPNTLETIRAALDRNADFIEIDANALASDDYLILHGPDISGETTASGLPINLTPAAADTIYFQPFNGISYRVPRLSEVVALFGAYPTRTQLQIDFKNVYPLPSDEPLERFARLVAPLGERVLVSTGADWQLRRLHKIAPSLRIGFDPDNHIAYRSESYQPSANPLEVAPPYRKGAYGYWDDHMLAGQAIWTKATYLEDRIESIFAAVPAVEIAYVDYRFVLQAHADGFNVPHKLHELGIRCDVWTLDVKSPAAGDTARELRALGVDLFTSNTPAALRQALERT